MLAPTVTAPKSVTTEDDDRNAIVTKGTTPEDTGTEESMNPAAESQTTVSNDLTATIDSGYRIITIE